VNCTVAIIPQISLHLVLSSTQFWFVLSFKNIYNLLLLYNDSVMYVASAINRIHGAEVMNFGAPT
jgi:hypothetical protein